MTKSYAFPLYSKEKIQTEEEQLKTNHLYLSQ